MDISAALLTPLAIKQVVRIVERITARCLGLELTTLLVTGMITKKVVRVEKVVSL